MASMLSGQDATDPLLPALTMPVLIVWGDQDHITPLAQGQAMLKLVPHAELDVFPGCGHLAPVDCANQIAPKMLDFVNR
jgi:pimeloyl-ACP methyl ester carboxylesterase